MSCSLCNEDLQDTFICIKTLKVHIQCYEKLSLCELCSKNCYDSKKNQCLLCGPDPVTYKCDKCSAKIYSKGKIVIGKILCMSCSQESYNPIQHRICKHCNKKLISTFTFGETSDYDYYIHECPDHGEQTDFNYSK